MAVWSTIKLSELDLSDRIDAEYFQPSFLSVATALDGRGVKLQDLGKLTCSAFYPAATHLYEVGDVPFIRCVDVISHPVVDTHQPFERIPAEFVQQNRSIRTVATDDIIITKVGTPCYAGVVHDSLGYAALTRTVLGLIDINKKIVDPYYLVVFLRSNYGFYQLMREREQQIQLQLTLERVGSINIYLPEMPTQKVIGDMLRRYYILLRHSKDLYLEAERELTTDLGVGDIDLSHQISYASNFALAMESHRLDAEYFQPKYSRVLKAISECNYPSVPLGALVEPIRNGFDYREYSEEGTPYIRVGDISPERIDIDGSARVAISQNDIEKDIALRVDDVLFTRKGTFGNAAVVRPGQSNAIISSEVMLLRLNSDSRNKVLSNYLSLFLNSTLGYQQVERSVHGVAYFSISQSDLSQVKIVLPPLSIQSALSQKVEQSLNIENEAKELLESAKHQVEQMIQDAR